MLDSAAICVVNKACKLVLEREFRASVAIDAICGEVKFNNCAVVKFEIVAVLSPATSAVLSEDTKDVLSPRRTVVLSAFK